MASNVTTLKVRARNTAKTTAAPTRSTAARLKRQHGAAAATGAVTMILVALSLSHLAHGIGLVTGAGSWERWAMAAGIDLGFVALEMSQLCAATEAVRRSVARYAAPAIVGTLAISAALNALAFAAAAIPGSPAMYAAAGLGIVVPALIYALSRITFALATGGAPRAA
ncbi:MULTISPECIES: hypothetical protein [unclassified Xanthobacter]|uniref:hypothetical protein n=1 Tax=unclassified Xanthobacter TaxID=2623496 RepID=UPI001F32D8CD|nr:MULTISPECIES: hypothetical protein [unclassified Xanthobacter]